MRQKFQIFRLIMSCTKNSYLDSKVRQKNASLHSLIIKMWHFHKDFDSFVQFLIGFVCVTGELRSMCKARWDVEKRYRFQIHCVAYLCAGVVLGWKPGYSSKFPHILATQGTLTYFHGKEVKKKKKMGDSKNWVFQNFIFFCFIPIKISQSFLGESKFWWLPWFPDQNNTCAKICNIVYMYKSCTVVQCQPPNRNTIMCRRKKNCMEHEYII